MRLITYERSGSQRIAVMITDTTALDLTAASLRIDGTENLAFASMQVLIEAGDGGMEDAQRMLEEKPDECFVNLHEIKLLAPLPIPMQMRDFANFELHCLNALESSMRMRAAKEEDPEAAYQRFKESGAYKLVDLWYEQPMYFKCNRFNVIGHEQDVIWPNHASIMDYELEYAAIIGKKAKDVPKEEAHKYIFGYTIYNDFSARDTQVKEMTFRMGPAKGKDFDTGNALGPWIVTADELTDPYSLTMVVRVNGEERGRGYSGDCQHDFNRCIEYVSQSETIYPGEILASGTVGNGSGFETQTFLEEGDVIELEVEGIGILRNRLVRN